MKDKKRFNRGSIVLGVIPILLVILLLTSFASAGQRRRRTRTPVVPTLGLEQGYLDFNTPDFNLRLGKASQVVTELKPIGGDGFDFAPSDRLEGQRDSNSYNHIGDITLRILDRDSGEWKSYLSSSDRKPVTALKTSGTDLAVSDMTPTLPADCPVKVIRKWYLDDGKLVLKFYVMNISDDDVEIGALGIPMIFNNIISGRNLTNSHENCSFFDPYIGLDAGYLQVTRLKGSGPALVVVPVDKTPFEAWQLLSEPTRPSQTFEGPFEWIVHSKAYADNEWKGVKPWNEPSSVTLKPGASKSYGVKFLVADEIKHIDKALLADKRPVAIGTPSYILPMDIDGRLFLNYPNEVKSIEVDPAGSLQFERCEDKNSWKAYVVKGKKWGRARATVTYADGTEQAIHYYVIKPAAQAIADMGNFMMTKQWFVDPCDPFKRSPSVITYDYEKGEQVVQDGRVWVSGLGDEGGSGAFLAAAMKHFGQPKKDELVKFEEFVNNVVWGGIQYSEGPQKYGVKKSMMYYEPDEFPEGVYSSDINWGGWTAWNKRAAGSTGRAYNYPHTAATYWSMYRLARNNKDMVVSHPWEWYLEHAYETAMYLTSGGVGYVNMGLMDGTIFIKIIEDLKREGWDDKVEAMAARMKKRTEGWIEQEYPFGSEMAWDSTGQEEVYGWCKYFGYDDKAMVSVNSILGYMPTLPHWGYNGCARRYWDFLYAGKLSRIERQLHHYGSGLNAIPIMNEYRENPDDFYLLRVGYGGMMGALSNINEDGFAAAAFHSFPDTLKWDGITGDYGMNFFGHSMESGTYIVNHDDFGWLAFGGNVKVDGDKVTVKVLDSMRKRVYIAEYGLFLRLDAGTFDEVVIDTKTNTVKVGLSGADEYTPEALLRVEQTAKTDCGGELKPTGKYKTSRDGYVIKLGSGTTWVELKQ